MKRLCKWAVATVAAFLAVDFAFGLVMSWVMDHAKGGDTYKINYINRRFDDSLAVMGSSRANHHYVSTLLEDSLGLTVYNCGVDGNGIFLAYCFLNNILAQGRQPAVIVYDFLPSFDLYEADDRQKPLSRIKPFYDIEGMKEILDDLSENEYLKLHLATYRYNSEFLQMLGDAFSPQQHVIRGYKPSEGTITTDFAPPADESGRRIDPLKAEYMKKFADLCRRRGIDLVFVTSPMFFEPHENDNFAELLRRYGGSDLKLLDFRRDSLFTGRKELFADPMHMNNAGATLFSSMLADSLRSLAAARGAE
ncbi:MAG: hypothetical protein K2L21_08470 [Muribaculaceae bacterium]|nr:hypothetical protein [Muribaculaceae bacterium]